LAPLALAATAVATYVIVHKAVIHKHTSPPAPIVQTNTLRQTTTAHPASTKAKFYRVRPNDTMSEIAARTGVPLSTLEALNPNVNPDALHPSQRIRLRR
jgi:LysM repeat protein